MRGQDLPDDVRRAKETLALVPQPCGNYYHPERPPIQMHPRFKLIEDPIAYEMEYKKRNVWSLKDIKTFVVSMLKHQKKMEKIGDDLPHKTPRQIVFFFHMFKKILNLKAEIKICKDNMNFKFFQLAQDVHIEKQAEKILQTLTEHCQKLKVQVEFDSSGL